MLRKIIAGTAVAGALTLGMAGAAGAATSGSNSGSTGNTGTSLATRCAKLSQFETKVQTIEGKVNNTWIPKLQDRENAAKTAGNTTLADRIANRITRIQNRESRVNARLQKLQAKCSAASSGTAG
jgi:hypothetical protein